MNNHRAATTPWIFKGDKAISALMQFSATKEGRAALHNVGRSAALDAHLTALDTTVSGINGSSTSNLQAVLATSLL